MVKIFGHGSYIGNTGYNQHTREFFRHLSKHSKIKFRNFTIGESWNGMNPEPHNNEYYFNDIDRSILYEQVLWNTDKTRNNHKMYEDPSKEFKPDVNIVLCETNHHLFYDEYYGPKIAYNVWESTQQPEAYFNKLKEFDELWVPSKWQRDCTIAQGYDPNKIKVVPEGVDIKTFFPEQTYHELTSDGRFKFFLAGRWDYRKSIKEIIETFLKTFDKDEPVDLIISVDNPFSNDGLKTTEERLEYYGLKDERIKILHFPPREDYVKILKSCNSFVSCSRSEGWNLPLIESMACGIPSLYSNCSGQLEYAEGKGIPVNVIGEKPVNVTNYNHFNDSIGNYYEPDFKDLGKKMWEVVTNYSKYKQLALEESEEIRRKFSWEKVAEIGIKTINEFLEKNAKSEDKNKTHITYFEGPKVEIKGNQGKKYFVEFIDGEGKVRFSDTITNNMWTTCNVKYYVPWTIRINGRVVDKFNLENKRVLITFESKSLGDSIAWFPYVLEFKNKHNCHVIVSTFRNDLFDKNYPELEFIEPGVTINNLHAIYRLGWFYNSYKEPVKPNTIRLQQTATNILGLEFKEIKPNIVFSPKNNPYHQKYVTIANESTSGLKFWNNPTGWQEVVDYLVSKGYLVINVSKNGGNLKGVTKLEDTSIPNTMNVIHHSEFFIGLSSGLSWLSWAMGKHVIMISNFTESDHEFTSNCTRINNHSVCNSCWNNPEFVFDKGDWNWCPKFKNTDRQFECHKKITSKMVIDKLTNLTTILS